MTLRKPCEHGLYEEHGPMPQQTGICPGGEFLADDAPGHRQEVSHVPGFEPARLYSAELVEMRLRKPCEHGRYDDHRWWDADGSVFTCPGGEFLADDALVIEKVDGKWPEWAVTILELDVAALAECSGTEILDALTAHTHALAGQNFTSGNCPQNHWEPGLGPCVCRGSKHSAEGAE